MTLHPARRDVAAWLEQATAERTEPLRHICAQLALGLRNATRTPAEAAAVLEAALEVFPDPASGRTTGPAELGHLLADMRALESAIAAASIPGDLVMMAATAHAHRCLGLGIRKAQAHSRRPPEATPNVH